MPIRIYALAKDLGIDSKELVEVCNRAGIPGKGSALASLDDDEVAKVKSFLQGPSKSSDAGATGSTAAGRAGTGTKIGRGGLASRRRGGATTDEPQGPISRDDYIAPTGHGGKIKVIDTRRAGCGRPTSQRAFRTRTSRSRPSRQRRPTWQRMPPTRWRRRATYWTAREVLASSPAVDHDAPRRESDDLFGPAQARRDQSDWRTQRTQEGGG